MVPDAQCTQNRNVPLGIFHSLVACFYWSIVFVIPSLLSSFEEMEIVLARYTAFGLFSSFALCCKKQNIFKIASFREWLSSIFWATLVNIVYYLGVSLAIRYVGSAVTIIISGLAPIAILFYSNIKTKDLPFSTLALISFIIFLGITLTNISEFQASTSSVSPLQYFFGLICVCTSTLVWTLYIICNSSLLSQKPHLTPEVWCSMLGISSLFVCVPLAIFLDIIGVTHIGRTLFFQIATSDSLLFIGLTGIMGIFSSSLAITAWNKASLHLSSALLGALLIFEPIFGLIISYIYEQALPSLQEGIGVSLMLGGSLASLILFHKKSQKKALNPETIE